MSKKVKQLTSRQGSAIKYKHALENAHKRNDVLIRENRSLRVVIGHAVKAVGKLTVTIEDMEKEYAPDLKIIKDKTSVTFITDGFEEEDTK